MKRHLFNITLHCYYYDSGDSSQLKGEEASDSEWDFDPHPVSTVVQGQNRLCWEADAFSF